MNVNLWLHTKFQKNSKVAWPCPNCNNASLNIVKDKFFFEETAQTKAIKNEVFFEYEWITYVFTGVLLCKNCENSTIFSGNGNVEHYSYVDYSTNEYEEGYDSHYSPTFFEPTLNLFIIPEDCPEKIKDEINNSFKLFWIDLSSCANKIRISLEMLMNELKINKTKVVKKGRARLNLHERILEYKKKNNEVGTYLEAIKWIGNSGSHIGNLERIDLLEAYQLLELSLTKLYDKKEAELKRITTQIIAQKGKRKRK